MKDLHWWLLSVLLTLAIASTEVYVCGWNVDVYECRLISDPQPSAPVEYPEPVDECQDPLLCIEQQLTNIP